MRHRVIGASGAQNPNANLTEAQVIIIRHLHRRYYWRVKKLLKLFPQISQGQMYNIINNTYWRDVK